ncbi:hypothetical protein GCM10010383_39170 [Streptomyces lomondensis]|uniref:Uncharacterized protein n=1 Tax=Streptomyces lomondensis TaxID=68229 RepID=A0ABQ2X8W8_9ACTN|nr:hypothetical protein GCM10010383_39170 [Streptomyces lomondensis]
MQPSGRTRPTPDRSGVLVHTTAPASRDARSTYTHARLRRRVCGCAGVSPAGPPGVRVRGRQSRRAARPRYSTGLIPYTRLNAVDRANALL